MGGSLYPMGAAVERPESDIKPPLGVPDFSLMLSPEVFSTSRYFCKTVGVWNELSLS